MCYKFKRAQHGKMQTSNICACSIPCRSSSICVESIRLAPFSMLIFSNQVSTNAINVAHTRETCMGVLPLQTYGNEPSCWQQLWTAGQIRVSHSENKGNFGV